MGERPDLGGSAVPADTEESNPFHGPTLPSLRALRMRRLLKPPRCTPSIRLTPFQTRLPRDQHCMPAGFREAPGPRCVSPTAKAMVQTAEPTVGQILQANSSFPDAVSVRVLASLIPRVSVLGDIFAVGDGRPKLNFQ